MRRKFIFRFLIVAALAFFGQTVRAGAEALQVFADYKAYPKNWLGPDGKPHGIMVDLLQAVSDRTGITFSYTMVPWKTAFEKSRNGEGGIVGLSKTTERQTVWDYSLAMYSDPLVLVTWKERPLSYSGLISLKGKIIGMKLGASYGDDFEQAVKAGLFTVIQTHDRVGQMKMLAHGRLDAVLVSPGAFALEPLFIEDKDLERDRGRYVIVDPPVKLDANYLGIPKSLGKSHLLAPINAALRAIAEDGTHARIVDANTDKARKALWFGN